jgi:ABC-type bacteriocin/lantibiotic exporter with double-glycine peptidase domain
MVCNSSGAMRPARLIAALAAAIGLLAAAALPALARVSVPWIGQKNSADCGRAVLASLAARRGGSPEAIYRRIPDPADTTRGYSITEMRRVGSRVGVGLSVVAPAGVVIAGNCQASPAVDAHFARLARTVNGGRPVVVPVSSGFGMGHYLILTEASGGSFTALDPASPGQRSLSAAELRSRMCGYGYVALQAN